MGVVVPSISKRIARIRWSIDEVTTEPQPEAADMKAPSTPAGSCDLSRYRYSGVSSPTGLETNESPGSFGLRKDQTNARFLAAHESSRRPLSQSRQAGLGACECETIRGHGE